MANVLVTLVILGQEHVPILWIAEVICQALKDSLKMDRQMKEIHIIANNTDFLATLWWELNERISSSELDKQSRAIDQNISPISAAEKVARSRRQRVVIGGTTYSAQTTNRERHLAPTSPEPAAARTSNVPCGFLIDSNVQVFIHRSDITNIQVDAVVNAANTNLYHGAGVARAISDAAGADLEKEGRELIRSSGPIPVSGTVVTTAGRLPCRKVIHAVGPRWPSLDDDKKKKHCLDLLRDTLINILHTTDKYRFNSIAMPAVISG